MYNIFILHLVITWDTGWYKLRSLLQEWFALVDSWLTSQILKVVVTIRLLYNPSFLALLLLLLFFVIWSLFHYTKVENKWISIIILFFIFISRRDTIDVVIVLMMSESFFDQFIGYHLVLYIDQFAVLLQVKSILKFLYYKL